MALTDKIVRDMIIMYSGQPHLVVEREFYKPGKGGAYNRTKLKNLRSGKVISQTFKTTEKVEELDITTRSMNYLYLDGDSAYFMDPNSFEQISISTNSIPGGTDYLKEGEDYIVVSYEGEILSVKLPPKIVFEVTETAGADRGNTSGNATKDATLDTGLSIQVPLFIKNGDRVIVNTEFGEYVSKE